MPGTMFDISTSRSIVGWRALWIVDERRTKDHLFDQIESVMAGLTAHQMEIVMEAMIEYLTA
jgi:hypothetical protein